MSGRWLGRSESEEIDEYKEAMNKLNFQLTKRTWQRDAVSEFIVWTKSNGRLKKYWRNNISNAKMKLLCEKF